MTRVLITGATGFVGNQLLRQLDRPVVLSRDPQRAQVSLSQFGAEAYAWDPQSESPPAEAFDGVGTVIHLAGDPVASGRWTAEKKKRIRESRVAGTRHLVQGLAALREKPRVLISASAVGYYGDRGDLELDESAEPGDDFLAEVCRAWEAEALPAREMGIRVVTPRIGIVLGLGGGALAKMLTPFRLGLGGRLGSGRQWMPWIHVQDLVDLLLYAAEHSELSGPINATAPHPVTNLEFTKTLGKVMRRPTVFPVPEFMLKLAMGDFGKVLMDSQRAIPRAAGDAGFQFQFPELEQALRQILGKSLE